MPIVFDEVTADIAPPADSRGAAEDAPGAGDTPPPDPLATLRRTLAVLAEREARLRAD